jgi:gliding motility-associated-like protein
LPFLLSNDDKFFIPEVITPDGNGLNDTWQVTWKDGIDPTDYRIQLFNGSGGKVYEMNGLHQNFDGGSLPDGVYWWTMQGPQGETVQSSGLTIRRR